MQQQIDLEKNFYYNLLKKYADFASQDLPGLASKVAEK